MPALLEPSTGSGIIWTDMARTDIATKDRGLMGDNH